MSPLGYYTSLFTVNPAWSYILVYQSAWYNASVIKKEWSRTHVLKYPPTIPRLSTSYRIYKWVISTISFLGAFSNLAFSNMSSRRPDVAAGGRDFTAYYKWTIKFSCASCATCFLGEVLSYLSRKDYSQVKPF